MAKLQAVSENPALKLLLMLFISIAGFMTVKYMNGTEESSKQLVGLVKEQNQSIQGLRGDVSAALTAMQVLSIRVDHLEKGQSDLRKFMREFHNGKISFIYNIDYTPRPPKPLIFKHKKYIILNSKERLWM